MNSSSSPSLETLFNEALPHGSLNEDQQKAVFPLQGIFFVRAGAGSGKTRTITARILHLILKHQVPPTEIVALTFTKKAANEMKERIVRLLPEEYPLPFIGTFHAYAIYLLKTYKVHAGAPPFTILDTQDRDKLLATLIKKTTGSSKITPSMIGSLISRYKNGLSSALKRPTPDWNNDLYHELFKAYESECHAAHCKDFDDLLLSMLELLERNVLVRQAVQAQVKHLLVDEYQDTNHLQHSLVLQLAYQAAQPKHIALTSLCVVGDENQSIYSWRGATITNMLSFPQTFAQTQIVPITQNYRSVQPILALANALITRNASHTPHPLWSARTAQDRVRCIRWSSSFEEALFIAHCAQTFQQRSQLAQLVVLYRSHFQSRAIEEALVHMSIPYRIVGGTQFYDRQEIKDVVSYFKYIVNPYDRISFARCITTPPRGLGDAFLEDIFAAWQADLDQSLLEVLEQRHQAGAYKGKKHEAVGQFLSLMQMLRTSADAQQASRQLLKHTHFLEYLQNSYEPKEAKERVQNVEELLNAVNSFALRGVTSIQGFLEEIALVQDHVSADEDEQNCLKLMTLHSAKGLEWHTVIITGLEQHLFPTSQSLMNRDALEEERRLLYVGVIRACDYLIMTHTAYRIMYGTPQYPIPSLFLKELPTDLVLHQEGSSRTLPTLVAQTVTWIRGKTPSSQATSTRTSTQHDTATPHSPVVWQVRQQVVHPRFGQGQIIAIDRAGLDTILHIAFESGTKKIAASFVKAA